MEEEKIKLEQINVPVIKYSKLWIKHKILELDTQGKQYTYDSMGCLESQSTSEDEQDPKGKGKVGSPFKIKIKGGQTETREEKKRRPKVKKRNITSKEKKYAQEEGKQGDSPVPKRRRVTRT